MKYISIFLILLIYVSQADARKKSKKKVFAKKAKKVVDNTHQYVSKNVLSFSNSIDEFFTKTSKRKLKNKSKLTLSTTTRFREAAGPYITPEINYRLVLPKTQDRLRLVLESDDNEKENASSEDVTNTRNDNEDNNVAAGLKYLVNKSGIDISTTAGVIVKIPVDVFIKFNAKKSIPIKNWVFKIDEQVKWVNNSGLTSDLDLNFDRRLSNKYLFRFVNNAFWNDNDYIITFKNGPSLFHKIDDDKALAYHAHVISVNEPDFLLTNYVLQVSYKQNLYKKWLYGSVTPFLDFPRTTNFHRVPGIIIGLDATFGHI
jgi:hypothetical protein